MFVSSSSVKSEKTIDMDKIYFKDLQRQFVVDLLKREGDFLLRRGSDGGIVLSVHAPNNEICHFKFSERQREYKFPGGPVFHTLQELLSHYHRTGKQVSSVTHAKLKNPIQVEFDLIDASRVKLEKKLGAGNFGEVWRAKLMPANKKGTPEAVAVKILLGNSSEKDRQECLAEAKIMSLLDHENVVTIRGVAFATTPAGESQLQIVIEYCNAGSLDKLLEGDKLSEEGKAHGLLDAAKGMQYLHDRDIIHRDIASRNCLAHKAGNRTIVKIADFGLSRMAPDHYELATKRKLPVFSMPPEALHAREWTKSSDVWSFGILILEMYNKGRNPYEQYFNEHKMDVRAVIKYLNEGKRVEAPRGMPPDLYEIAKMCMQKHAKRPAMDQVVDALKKYCTKHYKH